MGLADVAADLGGPVGIVDDGSEHLLNLEVVGVEGQGGLVDLQVEGQAVVGQGLVDLDGVTHRTALHRDLALQAVTTVGVGRQPQHPPRRCGPHDLLEGLRRDVVAFVSDQMRVAGEHLGEVVTAGQGLQHRDVHDPGGPVVAPADLTDLGRLQAETFGQLSPPLLDQRLAVHQHERGDGPCGDHRTPHDGLARARRCDQRAEVVVEGRIDRRLLQARQRASEGDLDGGWFGTGLGECQPCALASARDSRGSRSPRGTCRWVRSWS